MFVLEHQSGFLKHHNTETALLKVTSDPLIAAENGMNSVLVFLDLRAVFDHSPLSQRQRHWLEVAGKASQWVLSCGRFCVSANNYARSFSPPRFGLPQGLVLGPILFSCYLLPQGHIFERCGVSCHFYANASQI